jgi:LysM repeat protein
MADTRYVVRPGDSLWEIARAHLGDGSRWPVLYQHNNSPEVVQLTGMRIANPDLIFVGQTIYIPDRTAPAGTAAPPGAAAPSAAAPSAAPPTPVSVPDASVPADRLGRPAPATGRARARRGFYLPAFRYSLEVLPTIKLVSPAYIATIKYKGSVTIQSERTVEFLHVTKDGFEIRAKAEADTVLSKLVSDAKLDFNPRTREIKFECGFSIHSNTPFAPTVGTSLGISSETGLPAVKASLKSAPLKGNLDHHVFVTNDLKVEIEMTPLPRRMRPLTQPRPLPQFQWEKLVASALIGAALAIVAATIVEDILTAGAGTVDDPASFAAASAMVARGVLMWRTVRAAPVLIQSAGTVSAVIGQR